MTRKDYVAIAAALNAVYHGTAGKGMSAPAVVTAIVDAIADVLARDNSRFDLQRFEAAALSDGR